MAESRHPIRVPDDVRAKLYRLYRARNHLIQRLGREPHAHKLAQYLRLTVREVQEIMRYCSASSSVATGAGPTADTLESAGPFLLGK